ncbi:MAG TPA: Gfo/Idh/MocA family oxidoreductase [Armatimonadota bacterium]|nr:Gfo/Idh/MocA family oxidoreductase [Armatimonadota bacterium]
MRKSVRLGIVGAGAIARQHLEACQQCRGLEVTAICDVHGGRARSLAKRFGIANVFTDYRDLLAADAADAISVCTPNNVHMPATLAAVKAGKDVLCEKPLAMNAPQARRMVHAADKAGRILMTAQSARYTPAARFLKKLADRGRFGEIYYGKALWLRRQGIPRGWFQDAKQSAGGPLIDLGVHVVDLLWWLMGRPNPVSAYGVRFDHLGRSGQGMGDWGVGYSPSKFSVEDMIGGMIRFQDGRAIGLDISWAAHTADVYWSRFFGTKGGAQILPEPVIYGTEGKVKTDMAPRLDQQSSYAVEIQHFVECVRRREQPISPGSQAVVVMQMLDAVAKAARTGRMASIRTT